MLTEFESFVFENFVFSKRKRKKMLKIDIQKFVVWLIRIPDSDFHSFHSIGLAKRQRANNV